MNRMTKPFTMIGKSNVFKSNRQFSVLHNSTLTRGLLTAGILSTAGLMAWRNVDAECCGIVAYLGKEAKAG